MADLILLTTMFFVCGGIGLPLAELLPQSLFRWRALVAPVFGFAVLAVAAPIAYRWGASVPWIFRIACAVAAVMLAWRGLGLLRSALALPRAERRLHRIAVACAAAATLVMIMPRWVGGDQFAVLQGNQWDTYGYLDSAVVYAREPYSIVSQAGNDEVLRNPLYFVAAVSLTNRPSAHLLYAVFSRVAPGQAYRLYYAYLVSCFVHLVLATLFVMRNLLPEGPPVAWMVAALVFPLGFWGQYVFDINSWSQIASAPTLLLMTGLLIHVAVAPDPHMSSLKPGLRLAAAIAIVVAGAVYLYPEGFLLYVAAVLPMVLAVEAVQIVRERRFALVRLVPLAGLAGLAFTILYPPLLRHLIAQVTMVASQKVSWWTFFQAFFFGRDGSNSNASAAVADFAAGLFGLYFATPGVGTGPFTAAVQRLAIAVTIIGLLTALTLLVAGRAKLSGDVQLTRRSRHLLQAWVGASILLLLPAVYLARDGNYWPAGKAVAYAAPVFMMLLAVPAAYGFAHRALQPLRWIAIGFVAFQIGSGVMRISAAEAPMGIHYAPPYPALQGRALKTDVGWDLTGLERVLTPDMRVLIRPMDLWLEHYLMVFLWTRGIPFAQVSDVITAYSGGTNLGKWEPPWTPDVEISAEKQVLVLHFRDGRPDLKVVSGEGPE